MTETAAVRQPIFTVLQPDGTDVEIDLSTLDEVGDSAFPADLILSLPAATEYRATDSSHLILEPRTGATGFVARSDPPTGSPADIPAEQLWRFAASMIWRSYSDTQGSSRR